MALVMQTAEERREAVRRVRAFAQFKPDDIDTLMSCFRWRQMSVGDVLFSQGDYGDTLAVVAFGDLGVRVRRGENEVEVGQVHAGEMVGEMTCIDPAPRSATLVALSPTSVAELSRDALNAMREGVPGLSSLVVGAVIREVTRRLRDIEERIDRELDPKPAVQPPSAAAARSSTQSSSPPPADGATPWSGLNRLLDRLRGRT